MKFTFGKDKLENNLAKKQTKQNPPSSLIQLSGGQGWTSYLVGGCSDQQELPVF